MALLTLLKGRRLSGELSFDIWHLHFMVIGLHSEDKGTDGMIPMVERSEEIASTSQLFNKTIQSI